MATVVCIGDPVLDIVCHVEEEFLEKLGYDCGGSASITESDLCNLIELLNKDNVSRQQIPGGSAANVAKCLAALTGCLDDCKDGDDVYFVGMIGSDEQGDSYRNMMEKQIVKMKFVQEHPTESTGVCLCFVTPGGQRTMRTCLRAALHFGEMPRAVLELSPTLSHFEGYSIFRGDHTVQAMRQLRNAGSKISFDFASFEVVKACFDTFVRILESRLVDVMFCNEDELVAFAGQLTGSRRDQAILSDGIHGDAEKLSVPDFTRYMAKTYHVVMVVSRGSRGCIAASNAEGICSAEPEKVQVADTIGAGDHFSAAFLHLWIRCRPLEECCRAGCMAGAKIVQTVGGSLDRSASSELRRTIKLFLNTI
eukprot:jgi/Picsp_1/6095/NSC_03449-R1_sugar kinase